MKQYPKCSCCAQSGLHEEMKRKAAVLLNKAKQTLQAKGAQDLSHGISCLVTSILNCSSRHSKAFHNRKQLNGMASSRVDPNMQRTCLKKPWKSRSS